MNLSHLMYYCEVLSIGGPQVFKHTNRIMHSHTKRNIPHTFRRQLCGWLLMYICCLCNNILNNHLFIVFRANLVLRSSSPKTNPRKGIPNHLGLWCSSGMWSKGWGVCSYWGGYDVGVRTSKNLWLLRVNFHPHLVHKVDVGAHDMHGWE